MSAYSSNLIRFCFACLAILLLTACTTDLSTARRNYDAGNFNLAASEISAIEPESKDTIWVMLERGSMTQTAGQWQKSITAFEEAWRLIEIVWELGDLEKTGRKIDVGALLTGEDLRDYEGTPNDLILLKMGLTLSYAMSGQMDLAMVASRGMIDLQVDAWKNQVGQDKIEKSINRDLKSQSRSTGIPVLTFSEVVDKPEFRNARKDLDLYGKGLVADRQFPSGYFLGWIISKSVGNTAESIEFMKAMQRSLPDSPVTRAINDKQTLGDNIYVMFANGLAPMRQDGSVRFPIPMGQDIFVWIKVALPVMEFRPWNRARDLVVTADGQRYQTSMLDSVEAVEAWWFKEHLAEIWGRPIVSAVMKAAGSYAAQRAAKETEDWLDDAAAAVGTGIWSEATQPDLRNWSSLPAEHQGLVLKRPANGQLDIALGTSSGGTARRATFNLQGNGPTLLYVRSVNKDHLVAYSLPLDPQEAVNGASMVLYHHTVPSGQNTNLMESH
ncbi:MAG: hypothetical protein CMJ40_09260 [Phycisphaerae bacterium]|nr:hypothetical protein [Phycisphaerae bacterium]